jgi:hypothetical protein
MLPFTINNRAQQRGQLYFHYMYEIVSIDQAMEPLVVVFKQRMDGDVVIVDSLPPGDYRVSAFSFVPAGAGSVEHSYGDNRQELDIDFELEAGSITILPYSLNLEIFNSIPGRGMTTSYSSSLDEVTRPQMLELAKKLQSQKYFDRWKIMNKFPQLDGNLAGLPATQPAPL